VAEQVAGILGEAVVFKGQGERQKQSAKTLRCRC
jgi:hypothetical protein